jgi:hypothetical protein
MPNFKKFFNNKTIVSFDFDQTLAIHPYDEESGWMAQDEKGKQISMPNEPVINIMREASKKHKIIILTSRLDWDEQVADVKNFIAEHNLPVDDYYFTNNQPKYEKILELGNVIRHYDDDEEEIADIKQHCPETEAVLVEEWKAYWPSE